MHAWKNETIGARAAIVMGVVMAIAALLVVGGIGVLALLLQGDLEALPIAIAVSAVLACGLLLLSPLVGLVVSMFERSWYAFKFWSLTAIVALPICGLVAFVSFQFVDAADSEQLRGGGPIEAPGGVQIREESEAQNPSADALD